MLRHKYELSAFTAGRCWVFANLICSHFLGGSSVDKGSRRSVFTQFPVYKSNPCLSALVDSRWSFNKFTPATVLVTTTKTTQTTIKSNNITNNNNKINTNNSRSRSNGKERKTPTAQSCQQTMQQLANEKQHSQFPVHIHIVAQHYIVTQLEYKLFQTGGTELTKCFQNFAVLNMQCFYFFAQIDFASEFALQSCHL